MRLWTLKHIICITAFLFVSISFLIILCYPSEEKQQAYSTLTAKMHINGSGSEEKTRTYQQEEGVRKDLLITKPDKRHHLSLQSADAQLVFGKMSSKEIHCLLDGGVSLKHDIGTIFSQKAMLYSDKRDENREIDRIELQGDVAIKLQDGAALECHTAEIDYAQLTGHFLPSLGHYVTYTNLQGDEIRSNHAVVAMNDRSFSLDYPLGKIALSSFSKEKNTMEFQAEELHWEAQGEKLTLCKQVSINIPASAITLKCDDTVVVVFENSRDDRAIKTFETKGRLFLSHVNENDGAVFTLTCNGKILADFSTDTVLILSTNDFSDEQIILKDKHGEVLADKALLNYDRDNQHLALTRAKMQGRVCVRHNSSLAGKDSNNKQQIADASNWTQYALADKVEFNPKQHELLLASNDPHRVLYYDKVNNIQMSAPKLRIKKDAATKKEDVKAIGDVRFTFAESEFQQLLKRL